MTRSRENLLEIEEPTNVSFTINMEDEASDQRLTRSGARRGRTRSQAGIHRAELPNGNGDSRTLQLISHSLNDFRGEMRDFISNELRSMIQDMNISDNRPNTDDVTNTLPRSNQNDPGTTSAVTSAASARLSSDSSHEPFFAEKVLNIIRNWRLKFTGYDNGMAVEEFIYRVNILTLNNLAGDFQVLCRHAHSLFEGKALEWYWRYHRQNDDINWTDLTNAMKRQYKADYKDFDVLDDIRRRRQKANENFDEYLDVISAMTDKLKTPISDADLCEMILRNLKPEIRHELLHLNIASVANLRGAVRKHEKFMKDVHMMDQRKITKGRIAELIDQDKDMNDSGETETDDEICAIRNDVKCWNCDQTGHTFMDCMEIRRVFCYGCGVKDTYKPTCPNCSRKIQGNGLKDVRRK